MKYMLALALSALATLPLRPAAAADWPTRPVRIVVPFAAGGQTDVVARLLAQRLSIAFGQQFYIENQGGGGGAIGSKAVARSDPDGYTLMVASMGTHVLAPAMNKQVGFDPVQDFTHISYIGGSPNLFVLYPGTGVKSFADFTAWVKNSPDGIEYVSPGAGSGGHAVAEFFAAKAGLKLVHVPHRGGNTAVTDLMAGHVKLGSLTWTTTREHVRAGTLVPIAISSGSRLPDFPDIPTLKELGFPDIVTTVWLTLAGPRGLPQDIVDRLAREVGQALADPNVRKNLEQDAFDVRPMSPAEVQKFVHSENDKWGPAIRQALKIQ
jgi:tripartite-type tricarboxylate transporter receptor subunit TctC